MGKYILHSLIIFLLPSLVWGQSLNISSSSNTANNNPSTFPLQDGEISVTSNGIEFLDSGVRVADYEAFGISPDQSLVSVLQRRMDGGQIVLYSSTGDTLFHYNTVNLGSDDPSQAVYPFNSGHTLLQNNITNFTFYDVLGDISSEMSISSQTEEGEAISEVTKSEDGGTVVIFSPKIKRSGNIGSKAAVRQTDDGSFSDIFSSNDRFIKDVRISPDGGIIAIITAAEGSADQVLIRDKFGNELNTLNAEETLNGVTFSEDSEYITLYSTGRVMVFSTLSGERIGSTSIQNSAFQGKYFPEDNVILVLSGSYSESTGILNNVEFRAIDVERRQITSEGYGSALGFNEAVEPRLIRSSAGTYELEGASRELTISANF